MVEEGGAIASPGVRVKLVIVPEIGAVIVGEVWLRAREAASYDAWAFFTELVALSTETWADVLSAF